MGSCSCYSVSYVATGGLTIGGAADVTLTRIGEGGMVLGGSADVTNNHPFGSLHAIWLLDEQGDGTSDEFIDLGSLGLHGTGGDGTSEYTPTRVDALNCSYGNSFTTDDWIDVPADKLSSLQSFAISFWTRIDGIAKERTFFTRGNDSDWVFTVGHTWINHIWAQLKMSDGTIHYGVSTATLEDRWYHVAVSFDPIAGLKVYLNGSLAGSNTDATGETATLSTGSQIGKWRNGGFFEGTLQDVRLHPTARDAAWFLAERDNYCDSAFYVQGQTVTPVFS